ncbi:MAG TPA: histidine phosphatase family protein [Steroidobacter sp.]
MKRLLVLRHAKSSWADTSLDDWQRPLNDRGRRDAPRVGAWLRHRSLVPDVIVTSDAVRARETAAAVAMAAGCTREIVVEPSLYHATPADVIAVLKRIGNQTVRTVVIVGHNPGLENLVSRLSGEHHDLVTAAIVELAVPIDRWSELDLTIAATIGETWQPSR